jgi:tRNA A37 methylthiotransferase MiaB
MSYYKVLIDGRTDCTSNQINAAIIFNYLIQNNHQITYKPSKADFIIVVSCGVVESTREEYKKLIEKYNSLKKKKAIVIVFGCLVKIDKKLVETIDAIPISFNERKKLDDFFFKSIKIEEVKPCCNEEVRNILFKNKKDILSEIKPKINIKEFFIENRRHLLIIILELFSKKLKKRFSSFNNFLELKNLFFVEISRGCTGNCSYCVIKRAKGKVKSRSSEDIIEEIQDLYDPSKGLFLVADDCASYGIDIGSNLIELIYKINKKYPKLTININYISPSFLEKYSDEYIKLFKDINVDLAIIPIESGSDRVLKNMNRHYDIKKIIRTIDKIREISPNTVIMTDFIVGFPGERSTDFFKTISAANHFDFLFPLPYSENKDTPSSRLPDKKSKFIINLRLLMLLIFMNLILLRTLFRFPLFKKSSIVSSNI